LLPFRERVSIRVHVHYPMVAVRMALRHPPTAQFPFRAQPGACRREDYTLA
jgi:hypothetical protein